MMIEPSDACSSSMSSIGACRTGTAALRFAPELHPDRWICECGLPIFVKFAVSDAL